MGSWNETCFYSNLPIRDGDPAVLFITSLQSGKKGKGSEGRDRANVYYSNDLEEPISLPIKAKYNDCGTIEEWRKDDVAVLLMEQLFGLNFGEVLNRITNHMNDNYGLTIKHMLPDYEDHPVSFLMMHGGIYDKIVKKYDGSMKYTEIDLHDNFLVRERIDYLTQKKEKKTISEDEEKELRDIQFGLSLDLIGIGRRRAYWSGIDYRDNLYKIWLSKSAAKRESLINEYYALDKELSWLESSMHTLRRAFGPSSGCGSQYERLKHHLEFADIIKQTIAESFRDHEEMYRCMLKGDWDY